MIFRTFFRPVLPWALGFAVSAGMPAQGIREDRPAETQPRAQTAAPLKKLSLFSSGVGYFQHSGTFTGSTELSLSFSAETVSDALKSLVINDPDSSPSVSYPSEQTVPKTLRSLSVDLLGNPSVPDLLNSLKGAEIEITLPQPVRGRIMFVEFRPNFTADVQNAEPYLSVYTPQGVRTIAFSEMNGFAFMDPKLAGDLNRAMDLIMQSRDSETRRLTVKLPGTSRREVSLSYVIPAPVWKAAYRLDLAQSKPFLQGWAIVDNDSDTDWENIELSLVTGRPVSFIQNLYAPYRVSRPVVPLSIAGAASARTYDSGSDYAERAKMPAEAMAADEALTYSARAGAPAPQANSVAKVSVAGGSAETAQAQPAGDWFSFTVKKPVTLARRQSAMLPLVEGSVEAVKTLIFSGQKAALGRPMNPAVGAELTNTAGMKLPAGPITVYDGGTYAGDALLEFFPEAERRLIAYGEDLSVTGTAAQVSNRLVSSVTVRQGVMTIHRTLTYEKTYHFRNAGSESQRLIVEHPITSGTALIEPSAYEEKTDALYRFTRSLPRGTFDFTVREERPIAEAITLSMLNANSFASYTSNQEIPGEVRRALEGAVALLRKVDEAKRTLTELQNRRTRLTADQERTRKNLEAAGSQTQQGQEYLKRMASQDEEIDGLDGSISSAEEAVRSAQKDFDAYLAELAL
ncbi:MAG: DUF4139 domain-containing protein [Spirochaetaceae bacterium]|jgi:hypothetical protein|nr:DUF4139 domain-containing protein [Spirochaetaceae bacterium]